MQVSWASAIAWSTASIYDWGMLIGTSPRQGKLTLSNLERARSSLSKISARDSRQLNIHLKFLKFKSLHLYWIRPFQPYICVAGEFPFPILSSRGMATPIILNVVIFADDNKTTCRIMRGPSSYCHYFKDPRIHIECQFCKMDWNTLWGVARSHPNSQDHIVSEMKIRSKVEKVEWVTLSICMVSKSHIQPSSLREVSPPGHRHEILNIISTRTTISSKLANDSLSLRF